MSFFLLFKAFLLGNIWAGGLAFLLGYALHFFPLPTLFGLRELLQRLARGLSQGPKKAHAARVWRLQVWFTHLSAGLMWLLVLGLFLASWYEISQNYFSSQDPNFWTYYLSGSILAALLWLFQLLNFIARQRKLWAELS